MKVIFRLILLFLMMNGEAQQTVRYTQYLLNNYGSNPAYPGSNSGLEFLTGRRHQWYGMDYAPVSTFGSAMYTYRGNYSFKGWHGFGLYLEQDNFGLFSSRSGYLSYAFHVRLIGGVKLGLGTGIGLRSQGISYFNLGGNDPVNQLSSTKKNRLPDFNFGLRLYSKKFLFDLSTKRTPIINGMKNTVSDGYLDRPAIYLTYGQKFHSETNEFMFVPTVHLQQGLSGTQKFKQGSPFPKASIDAGLMVYYRKRIGLGAQYRFNNAISGIVQAKVIRNMVLGFAYDYSLGRIGVVSTNTYEFMFGFSPIISDEEKYKPKRRVAQCPEFDF